MADGFSYGDVVVRIGGDGRRFLVYGKDDGFYYTTVVFPENVFEPEVCGREEMDRDYVKVDEMEEEYIDFLMLLPKGDVS